MSRKQFRNAEDGTRTALASACVDCGAPDVYSLDRCHAHYMREYRRRRSIQIVTESPKTAAAAVQGKAPNQGKPRKAPKPEEFESVNYAAISLRRNI